MGNSSTLMDLGPVLGEGILWKLFSALSARNIFDYEAHRGRLCGPIWAFLLNCSLQIYETLCCCCCIASVVSNSVRPHRRQPTRIPHPWDSPGKNTGVGCHFLLQCMKVKSESEVAQLCPILCDPTDCGLPGSSSMGFSRQEFWSGVPLPSPNVNL